MLKRFFALSLLSVFLIQNADAAYVYYRCKGDSGYASHGADDAYDAMVEGMAIASSVCGDKGYEIWNASKVYSVKPPASIGLKPTVSSSLLTSIPTGQLPVVQPGNPGVIYKSIPTKTSISAPSSIDLLRRAK